MTVKAKLATILRSWADRLSPVPAAAASTFYVNFGGDGDGVIRYPTITAPAQIIADQRFDHGGTEWAHP
jgi:hypothetical protein